MEYQISDRRFMTAEAAITTSIKTRSARSSKANARPNQVQHVLDLFEASSAPSLPLLGDGQKAGPGNLGDSSDSEGGKALLKHHCHWPGCGKEVPPAMWGCKGHWFALPKDLRDLVWQTYRPGQEVSKKPSPQYIDAARRVRNWILEQQNTSPKGILDHAKL